MFKPLCFRQIYYVVIDKQNPDYRPCETKE